MDIGDLILLGVLTLFVLGGLVMAEWVGLL